MCGVVCLWVGEAAGGGYHCWNGAAHVEAPNDEEHGASWNMKEPHGKALKEKGCLMLIESIN